MYGKFKIVLHVAALLLKHHAKDRDSLIEQSVIASINKSMALPYKS